MAACTLCAEGARRSAKTCAQQGAGGKVAQAGRWRAWKAARGCALPRQLVSVRRWLTAWSPTHWIPRNRRKALRGRALPSLRSARQRGCAKRGALTALLDG